MKILIKLIALIAITLSAYADVDTAYIVIPPSTVQPDCNTWTGCGVIIQEPIPPIPHYYKRHVCRSSIEYQETDVLYPSDTTCE